MRKLRTTLTVLTLAFLLVISACSSSDSPIDGVADGDTFATLSSDVYQNWVPTTVEFQSEEYTVYYKIGFFPNIDRGWKNENINTIYQLRDEATKSDSISDFKVVVWFRDGKERFVSFSWWDEVNPDSFLQRIIINNIEEDGEKIFFNFVRQIKEQNPSLP